MAETALKATGRPARGGGVTPPARLVRLHRHNLVNLLVLGGTPDQRVQVAYAFHRDSAVRRGPFVCIDGRHEQDPLRLALQQWMVPTELGSWSDPLRAAQNGTLFLDSVGTLSSDTQRMLLAFMRNSMNATDSFGNRVWVGRLAVGNGGPLSVAVSEGRFLAALYDSLDKVCVELPFLARRVA